MSDGLLELAHPCLDELLHLVLAYLPVLGQVHLLEELIEFLVGHHSQAVLNVVQHSRQGCLRLCPLQIPRPVFVPFRPHRIDFLFNLCINFLLALFAP